MQAIPSTKMRAPPVPSGLSLLLPSLSLKDMVAQGMGYDYSSSVFWVLVGYARIKHTFTKYDFPFAAALHCLSQLQLSGSVALSAGCKPAGCKPAGCRSVGCSYTLLPQSVRVNTVNRCCLRSLCANCGLNSPCGCCASQECTAASLSDKLR